MRTPTQTPMRGPASTSKNKGGSDSGSWFTTIVQVFAIFFSVVWLLAVVKVFLLDDGGVAGKVPSSLVSTRGLVDNLNSAAGVADGLVSRAAKSSSSSSGSGAGKTVHKSRPRAVVVAAPGAPDVEELTASKKVYVRHVDPPRTKHSKGTVELPLASEWQLIRTNPNYKVGQNPNYKSEINVGSAASVAAAPVAGALPVVPSVVSKVPLAPKRAGGLSAPYELQWPPVQMDGSVLPSDGTEKMPITGLDVPRFWEAPPGSDLNTIGTKVNGQETIFLMIASYRDFQCRETITSAYKKSDHPERLYVAAVDQLVPGDIGCLDIDVPCSQDPTQMICVYRKQISIFKMDATQATGPVTARHIGDRLYRGQSFVMQMDAHCLFVRHWDTNIISQWRQTGNEMAVLSSYLTDVQGSIDALGDSTRDTRPIMCNSDFEGAMPARYLRHGSQPEDVPTVRKMPQLQPFWAAGFSFSRGHFKLRVPYDAYQPMVFQGEEIAIGIRGFTFGYDYYAPRDSVVFHEYAERSKRRKKIPMFWENSVAHRGEGQKSLRRGTAVIGMAPDLDPSSWDHAELDRYGLGKVRELSLFYRLFLIDAQTRTATQLCPFVKSGVMHRNFQKFLRSDRLGIDYSRLADFNTRKFLPAKKADPFSR